MTRLSDAALAALPPEVARPRYDRARVTTGIVHLGVGAFHRAHQAAFVDDCLNVGARDWGITAASLRSPATRDALVPQDGLYTLALRQNSVQDLSVVGAIRNLIVAPENPNRLLLAMADPAVRIVSLTITEKGYTTDLASRDLLVDHPEVQHDLAHPGSPRTALGFIAEALARRRAAGIPPFTLLSCDNLPGNGNFLHRILSQYAAARDPELARHVAEDVACPSTMVDRIVPATTETDRETISRHLGMTDAWPVVAEPFFQWVIEDHFPTGRPEWEISGVEFTANVAPYETMKLRLLNGAHTTIAAMGRIAGFETVAEAFAVPEIRAIVGALWTEVAPTIAPAIDVAGYTARLGQRFDNTALRHKCTQIATDASLKVPQRLLAPLNDLRAMRHPAPILTFALAAWIRSCLGADEAGRPLPINDPPLQDWVGRPEPDAPIDASVHAFAGLTAVFGPTPDPDLLAALAAALVEIRKNGILAAARLRLESLTQGERQAPQTLT